MPAVFVCPIPHFVGLDLLRMLVCEPFNLAGDARGLGSWCRVACSTRREVEGVSRLGGVTSHTRHIVGRPEGPVDIRRHPVAQQFPGERSPRLSGGAIATVAGAQARSNRKMESTQMQAFHVFQAQRIPSRVVSAAFIQLPWLMRREPRQFLTTVTCAAKHCFSSE